jgi:2-polyprenyl-3-methyl-5-hydroxy-6-metoxy-1,4-benzoquinol methylase
MVPQVMEMETAEEFAGRMVGMMNGAALMLMTSIGHRTGLFDTMASMAPATSEKIAANAGLNERYVREWLGAMTTGNIVSHNPEARTYWLPPEHAAFLTRAATPNNIAASSQFIAVLGSVEDGIVECFEKGGGLPYSAYKHFHAVMADESNQTVVAKLFDFVLPLAGDIEQRLEKGIRVADFGCGMGRALRAMANRYPKSRFVGYDFSADAIRAASQETAMEGLSNITFEVADVATVLCDKEFDLVCTFDAIHDQAQPMTVLENIQRALRPGGVYLMQEIQGHTHVHDNMDNPLAPFVYTVSCMHCMSVSLHQGGAGLGAAWGQEMCQAMLEAAGFEDIRMHIQDGDIQSVFFVARAKSR